MLQVHSLSRAAMTAHAKSKTPTFDADQAVGMGKNKYTLYVWGCKERDVEKMKNN